MDLSPSQVSTQYCKLCLSYNTISVGYLRSRCTIPSPRQCPESRRREPVASGHISSCMSPGSTNVRWCDVPKLTLSMDMSLTPEDYRARTLSLEGTGTPPACFSTINVLSKLNWVILCNHRKKLSETLYARGMVAAASQGNLSNLDNLTNSEPPTYFQLHTSKVFVSFPSIPLFSKEKSQWDMLNLLFFSKRLLCCELRGRECWRSIAMSYESTRMLKRNTTASVQRPAA